MTSTKEKLVNLLMSSDPVIPKQISDIYHKVDYISPLVQDARIIFDDYSNELTTNEQFYRNYLALLAHINIINTLNNPKPENRKTPFTNEFINMVINLKTDFIYV